MPFVSTVLQQLLSHNLSELQLTHMGLHMALIVGMIGGHKSARANARPSPQHNLKASANLRDMGLV
eukprot:217184-Amphidinium_carterae.2